MPIDLSQAISGGVAAPASSPPSGISLDSLYKNVKPAQSNVASSLAGKVWDSAKAVAVQTGRDWYSEWTNEIDQSESRIRTNLKQLPTEADYNNPERVTRNPIATLGSLLLNIGSLVATPFRATVEAGPVRVAQSVAKPVYKATKTDPDEQAMINEFMENVIQIGAGLIGGVPEASAGREAAVDFTKLSDSDQAMLRRGPKPRYRVVGTAANGKPIMRQVLPGGAAEAPKPVPTIAKASSIAMNAFDELAMKSESAAKTVAAQVEKTHPVAGKALAKRAEEKAKAPLEEQVATGEVSARDAATGWDTEPGSIHYWDDLNSRMTLDLSAHTANFERGGITVSSKKLLSTLRDRAQSGSNEYVNSLLEKIASRAPDLPVHFRRMLQDETGADRPDIAGWYIHKDTMRGKTVVRHAPDHIEVRTEGARNPIKTLVHELVHSATVKFMEENPEHPATKEIERLYNIAKARFSKMPELSGEETKSPYGITNPKEFVAEALSNPDFQDWLIYSEGYKLPGERMYKSLWSRFTTALHKVFGIKDPMEAQLLHATTRISTHIMDLQAQGAMNAATEGASKAAATAYRLGDRGDAFEVLRKFPREKLGMGVVEGKVKEYWRFLLNNIAPESLGIEAKKAGATIAEAIAKRVQDDVQLYERGKVRRDFWMKNQGLQKQFIDGLERGEDFRDPTLKSAAKAYSAWTKAIVEQDHSLGIEYDPVDHYVPHIFKDPQAVEEWAQQRFGVSWTKPGFTKDRSFDLYFQAIKAGFEPKFTNPEDIMQARQQASNMARMKVETLRELERQGLAVKSLPKDKAPAWLATKYPSPNGDSFWVHKNAAQVLHNAFNSRSLWSMKGPIGDAFRGLMWMKNKMVPIRLAASLFHPLHIATIHNVTGMVRASKELFAGKISPLEWGGKMAKEMTVVWSNIEDSRLGSRLMQAYKGKISDTDLSDADRQSLQYMVEGGLTPELSMVYRGRSMDKFREALAQRKATSVLHAPFAAMEAVQGLLFQKWIPSLKVASYLKDVKTALSTNPELAENADLRRLAFRKLAKSVDNRYGEMAYNTLFWNRWVKDLAVANTLSLGWQLGFLREFGGGAIDAARAVAKPSGSLVKEGDLDRSMFSAYYLTTTLGYGGLLTWAMTGKPPSSLIDYIYPQTGETGQDGKPQRVSTMFYTREIASMYDHYEQEGAVSAISNIAKSKAAGQIGLINEWLEGVNDFGQEIRDPDAPAYKQLEQTLARTLVDLQPISVAGGEGKSGKDKILSGLGFTQAPKYADRSKGEGAIVETYSKYYAPKETPYDKALYSQDTQGLRQLYASGDYDKFDSTLDAVQQKYNLTGTQVKRLVRTMAGGKGSYETMFQHFSFDQQKKILGKMTPEEREKYVPLVSREHREEAEEAFGDGQ